jgi:hypothetical protein
VTTTTTARDLSHKATGSPEYTLEDVDTVRQLWAEEFVRRTDVTGVYTRTVGYVPSQLQEAIDTASDASVLLTVIGYIIMV